MSDREHSTRHSVAEQLRKIRAIEFADGKFCNRVMVEQALGLVSDGIHTRYEAEGVRRLADLIQPESWTCRMKRVEEHDAIGNHEVDRHKFVCGNCGEWFEFDGCLSYPYLYCPVCGAEVAENGDE